MEPADCQRISGKLLQQHALHLKLRFGRRPDRHISLSFRYLCRHGMEYALLRTLKFCEDTALDLMSWKLFNTALTSPNSTLSTTLRTVYFPHTSERRDDTKPPKLSEFSSSHVFDSVGFLCVAGCSATFDIRTPISEYRRDGILTVQISGQSMYPYPPGGAVLDKLKAWGSYMPFVKNFIQKVAALCEGDTLSLLSANISNEDITIDTDVGHLMRNIGLGDLGKPVSVPQISYDTISFRQCRYGRVFNKWADTDMASIKDITLINCQKTSRFLQACMNAPVPAQIQRFICHHLDLDDTDTVDSDDPIQLMEFVYSSVNLEELRIITGND
jgi:hypothetical protein